jgi:hypothetical protein
VQPEKRRAVIAACAGLLLVLSTVVLVLTTRDAKPNAEAGGPVRVAETYRTGLDAGADVSHYILFQTDAGSIGGAALALLRRADLDLIPEGGIPSYLPDGTIDPSHPTLHELDILANCYVPGEYAIVLRTNQLRNDLAWAQALLARCQGIVDAGQATGNEAACLAVVTATVTLTLPARWAADGGACWWWPTDGGVPMPPPLPADLYDGATP